MRPRPYHALTSIALSRGTDSTSGSPNGRMTSAYGMSGWPSGSQRLRTGSCSASVSSATATIAVIALASTPLSGLVTNGTHN